MAAAQHIVRAMHAASEPQQRSEGAGVRADSLGGAEDEGSGARSRRDGRRHRMRVDSLGPPPADSAPREAAQVQSLGVDGSLAYLSRLEPFPAQVRNPPC